MMHRAFWTPEPAFEHSTQVEIFLAIGFTMQGATDNAKQALLASVDVGEEIEAAKMDIIPFEFGDCWLKRHEPPYDDADVAPFTLDEVIISPPGHHPGGKMWWITPFPDVLAIHYQF